jgi:putative ABC transport system permease protein
MLINEAMAKALGYKSASEAIGKPYKQGRGTDHGNIIGVVKDFHFHSFAEAIQPLTLRWGEGYYTCNTINCVFRSILYQHSAAKFTSVPGETLPSIPLESLPLIPG